VELQSLFSSNIYSYLNKISFRNDQIPNEQDENLKATNTELYNAMIYPFTRMVVTGAIWYQGKYFILIIRK
jgi:hypothetical protein